MSTFIDTKFYLEHYIEVSFVLLHANISAAGKITMVLVWSGTASPFLFLTICVIFLFLFCFALFFALLFFSSFEVVFVKL